jgi:hypothetical protein
LFKCFTAMSHGDDLVAFPLRLGGK